MLGSPETVMGALFAAGAASTGALAGAGCAAFAGEAFFFLEACFAVTSKGGSSAGCSCATAFEPIPKPHDTAALTMIAADRGPLLLM
jgi:hypothetical protein